MMYAKLLAATALLAMAPAAVQAQEGPVSYEEQLAQVETQLVYQGPIAGVENDYWFNYQTDLAEARKELTGDLRGSSDAEDNRDAWEEFRAELADARGDYAKEMAEKGYPVGEVRVLTDNGR
ncbi:hypothetical protein [Sphingobium cupriresistens]|uniref:Uncharacterized protein n=1 Tax=Sphingobium cupriresistens TaxID=1132417 RepID=A0A8G1ZLJ3_9SPHN|nr:hypothetical protein [Sphingobium cupriresistens]RYM10525.1 hypothetical protein EWH12_11770 [Sphingobium cupriresistens]